MRPESVEIKVTLSGVEAGNAVTELELSDGQEWQILFCEDVSVGVAPSTPLLDLGVVLRIRRKSGRKGDTTVKLRPCRWSQLSEEFFTNDKSDRRELKIEADWSGPKRTLAAALTADWDDDRVAETFAGHRSAASLFEKGQRRFLDQCGAGRVNLDAVTVLAPVAATRWKEASASVWGRDLSYRAERWIIDDIDFLELSIVSDPANAEDDQAALHQFVAERSLASDQSQENKTQRVVRHLVERALAAAAPQGVIRNR